MIFRILITTAIIAAFAPAAPADTLTLADGTTLTGCYARDEGVRYLVWENMADVGTPNMRVIPRSQVKEWKVERDVSWDAHADLPDLTVTFIEMNPKLAGLHWRVQYDLTNRPILGGAKALVDIGERAAMEPEEVARDLKLKYKPGEEITLTAHVKNVGFAPSKPFEYVWLIDGKEVDKGKCSKALGELEETSFPLKWDWQDGRHTVTFKITTRQPEIATINNEATDPLWGWGFVFVINKNRTWHDKRNACGSFCFEDYYRWHVDLMNTLFAASIYPSAPEGIVARVRLDRIIYCDDPSQSVEMCTAPDGMGYLQGMWTWSDSPEEKENGWPTSDGARSTTEWSLPHELGHQLGLTDWYALDNGGSQDFVWPDNGEPICHLMSHPIQMMCWHGPHLYGEGDAGYLNYTWDKPRGHFGDLYFAIPRTNYLRIVDVNGIGVPGAKVELHQRGCVVDPAGQPGEDHGVTYYPVIEDGNRGQELSKQPVIVGTTDAHGMLRLPNRPVIEVKTLNGFHLEPNPFGQIDVVGVRGQMLVKVTKNDRPAYYWLQIYDFCVAWFRGQKDSYTTILKTPYGSPSSPLAPRDVEVAKIDDTHVKISWSPPKVVHEMQYLEKAIGYRVYRRIGPMGLNDRPWFCVATLNSNATECIIDLTQRPDDTFYYTGTERYAVSSLGDTSMESELVEAPLGAAPR
jgi:hypothetical protein